MRSTILYPAVMRFGAIHSVKPGYRRIMPVFLSRILRVMTARMHQPAINYPPGLPRLPPPLMAEPWIYLNPLAVLPVVPVHPQPSAGKVIPVLSRQILCMPATTLTPTIQTALPLSVLSLIRQAHLMARLWSVTVVILPVYKKPLM